MVLSEEAEAKLTLEEELDCVNESDDFSLFKHKPCGRVPLSENFTLQ